MTKEELSSAISATKHYMKAMYPQLKSITEEDMIEVHTVALQAAALKRNSTMNNTYAKVYIEE